MKKKVFKPLQLNKEYITKLENRIKGGGREVPAPSIEWCPTKEECGIPTGPIGPLPTTIFPIC